MIEMKHVFPKCMKHSLRKSIKILDEKGFLKGNNGQDI